MLLKNFISLFKVFLLGAILSAFLPVKAKIIALIALTAITLILVVQFAKGYDNMYSNIRTALVFIFGYLLMFLPLHIVVAGIVLVLILLLSAILFLYKKAKKEKAVFGDISHFCKLYIDAEGRKLTYVKFSNASETASMYDATDEEIRLISEARHVESHLFYQKIGEQIVFEKIDLSSKLITVFEDRILKKIKI